MTIAEMRKICEAATRGPWWKDEDPRPGMEWNCEVQAPADNPSGRGTICFMAHDPKDADFGHNNAAFISAARTYLPLLLDVAEAAMERPNKMGPHFMIWMDKMDAALAKLVSP